VKSTGGMCYASDMSGPNPTLILYPVFAMFLLVAIVLLRMRAMRFGAVRQKEVDVRYYKAFQGDEEPEALRVVARHFANLFEVPVLFYVGVLMTYVTHQVTHWLIGCAWLYVALRYAHSWVHLTRNDVVVRFSLYFASGAVLVVMWSSLLVQLVRTGG
jgi:hypothetical protein